MVKFYHKQKPLSRKKGEITWDDYKISGLSTDFWQMQENSRYARCASSARRYSIWKREERKKMVAEIMQEIIRRLQQMDEAKLRIVLAFVRGLR